MSDNWRNYAPDFSHPEKWSDEDRYYLEPFVTNCDGVVTALRNLPPELAGAVCSRASRSEDYLPRVLLKEYIYPILQSGDEALIADLKWTIEFLRKESFREVLNNRRARQFFIKWLAQYGDESIAQMLGVYLVFWGISQVTIKFLEDARIGLTPIEKSTRYVNFGKKVEGKYLYYTDPDLMACGLEKEYRKIMDSLFETYLDVIEKLKIWLSEKFPEAKPLEVKTKAFDVARGLLPMSTLGQVAFFGNGQAFEYMMSKCVEHELGELRWVAGISREELDKEIPSMFVRLDDPKIKPYQHYLASRRNRVAAEVEKLIKELKLPENFYDNKTSVRLVEYNPDGESVVAAAIMFPSSNLSWEQLISAAKRLSEEEKIRIIGKYLEGRSERWQKVGRALENVFVRFEIITNAGAYRDLHRHRMLTQERQLFTVRHGYDLPPEIVEMGLADRLKAAMDMVGDLYEKIDSCLGEEHAQYATTLFHRIRFYQFENLREFFWEGELRSGTQGHPDYRKLEQEKYRLLRQVYPIITDTKLMFVDMKDYDFARRGTEEKIKNKESRLLEKLDQTK